ncbi:PepSY domain-containing protein [Streptomyces sp. 549]|uniref:PepSY domain-containing protein n=1 Tax=Streptomyces sp. 549 TaxID=3049076 RepID=UPI0024C3C40C|nr:PepSY domain-containing protein [Streptomyces sp. 549]MDK1474854.1 PepSY domain-containing protein [Streptomyces sp. 549]
MRTPVVITLAAVGMAISLTAGGALASAGQTDAGATAQPRAGGFEVEIDPELDARFGPRVLNAAEAADIVTARFPGARVLKVELDKDDKRPVWEVEADRAGDGFKVDVDATDGTILR